MMIFLMVFSKWGRLVRRDLTLSCQCRCTRKAQSITSDPYMKNRLHPLLSTISIIVMLIRRSLILIVISLMLFTRGGCLQVEI